MYADASAARPTARATSAVGSAAGEALAHGAGLLADRLDPVPQREEPLEALTHLVEARLEDREELLRARRRLGHARVVARVHHRLDALRVAHERRDEGAVALVPPRRRLGLRVQEPDEGRVEPRLPLERRGESGEGARERGRPRGRNRRPAPPPTTDR